MGPSPRLRGGGLAEREFLFREVGLERWLNGLDLQGHDAAEKLERRRQKFERRRRRQQRATEGGLGMDVEGNSHGPRDTLRYGTNDGSPVEALFDDDDSASESDDEPPEATGQIKVAMFRVIASGEIKKGEYSPQFDAHDDDDEAEGGNQSNGTGIDADVEHTTSFAKPKTLDPKTISTQTVTGIDGPEKPYATFTFFYRGERKSFSSSCSLLTPSIYPCSLVVYRPTPEDGRAALCEDPAGHASCQQTAIRPARFLDPGPPENHRNRRLLYF
jgi:hypothetical protein